ncbi:hypothetical protein [Streptomyces sp. NPDC001507]
MSDADLAADVDRLDQQLTREDLDGMTPEEILRAKAEGRLDGLLGRLR